MNTLQHSYDPNTDIITIEGVKYAAVLFKSLPFPSPPHTWLRVVKNDGGIITVQTHRESDKPTRIDIGKYTIENQSPYGPMLMNELGEGVGINEEKMDKCFKDWF